MASFLADDFDPAVIGDDSKLPADALGALRELAWRQAQADPIWFMEKFWWCMNPFTFKWEQFKPREYQRSDLEAMVAATKVERDRKVILKARQIGWTTEAAAFAFHNTFFVPNHPWIISSQGEDEAKATLSTKVKQPYARLPLWMRNYPSAPKPTDDNAETFSFDNGSSIMSVPATSSAGRSKAVYGALVDEYAYVGDASGLLTALDPLCYGPMFVFSTADGMGNPFHNLWLESQTDDAEWEGRFHPWYVVPERGPFTKDADGNITSKWYQREKRKYRGREHEFYQENPASPEEAFAKSGRTVLPIDILRTSGELVPPVWRFPLPADYDVPLTAEYLDSVPMDPYAPEELWVWEAPSVHRDERNRLLQQPNYVVAVDVAEGLPHGDRTSIDVVNANTGEQAAAYRGYWEVEELGELIEWIAYGYFEALILVERNNHGLLPLDYLRRNGYPRLYRMASLAAIQITDRTPRFGWITTSGSKPKLVFDLIKAIKDGVYVIHDDRFLQEATTFVANGKGGFGASPSAWDDHVISHGIAWQGVMEVGQYPTTWYDDSPLRVTFGDLRRLGTPVKVAAIDVPIGGRQVPSGTRAITL